MKNKQMLEEGKEALQRTLLMMKYDMKKTLTENVEVISEQTTIEKDIKDEIIDATVKAFGTNTKDLRDAIKKITNKSLYDKVNAELVADRVTKKYFPNDRTIVGILNDELGSGDLKIANEIANHLKTLGVNVVVTPANVTDKVGQLIASTANVGKIAISTEPVTKNKTGYFTGVFSCVAKTSANQTEGTYQGQKIIRDTQPSSMTVYWEDGHWTRYAYNDKTKKTGGEVARGKFKCNGTKQTMTTDTNVNKQNVEKQKTSSITDKNVLNTLKFDFQYPGDKAYSYAFVPGTVAEATSTQNGTWYAKNNKTGKVFDISKNYPQTAQKLSTQFPNGDKAGTQTTETPGTTEVPGTTETPGTTAVPKVENKANWDDVVKYYEGNKDPKWKFRNKGEVEFEGKMYDYVAVNAGTNSNLYFWGDGTVDMTDKEVDNIESFGTWEWDGTKPVITPPGTAATDIKDIKGKGIVKPVVSLKQPQNINLQTKPEVKESLKKSLKKNLLEVKEKKQDLLIESNIIRKRFEMISEGRDLNIDTDSDYIVESLFAEISYLKRQGYNRTLINEEGVFGWLGSLLGGTATEVPDVIKEYVSSWLLKKMGVSADSYFGNVIVTLIGDLSFSDYDTFFSDCRFASNKVSDALINGYLRQLQEENDSTSGAGGFVISAIRNAIVTYFADSKDSLIQKLEDQIINFLCPILSKLTGVMGDKASDIKQKVMS